MDLVLEFRRARESDLEFLTALRRGTMWAHFENSGVPVDELEQSARVLLRLDCAQIVSAGGRDIGLLKVCRDENPWELIQIQLLPEYQRQGLGGSMIESVLAEARDANVSVTLHVLNANPARRLYERLGFQVIGEHDHGCLMRVDRRAASGHPTTALCSE